MTNKNYVDQIRKGKELLPASLRFVLFISVRLCLVSILFIQSSFAQRAIGKGDQQTQAPDISLRGAGMNFTQNKGQIVDMAGKVRPDILFKGDGGGADIYIRKTGISYVQSNIGEVMHEMHEQAEERMKNSMPGGAQNSITDAEPVNEEVEKELLQKIHRIDIDFVNGNLSPRTIVKERLEGYSNFYYAHCPKGITNVNSYNEVTIKNVYNNIDVKYYGGKQNGLKYDIVVNPGGNPNQIKLKYSGAKELRIDPDGLEETLIIETSIGRLGEYMPKVYQNINGKVVDVKARYILNGTTVNFELETMPDGRLAWNPELPLIIDPWVSYYGGESNEWGHAVTNDPSGNVAFVGETYSYAFPISVGAFQTSLIIKPGNHYSANIDAFVVKMNPAGNRLWATYYGGTEGDYAHGVVTDAAGNISVSGQTTSLDLPIGTSGANVVHQNSFAGVLDAYLLQLNPAGMRLWATYYGGTDKDFSGDLASDGNNVYLYGETKSLNGISTAGSFQSAFVGVQDVFVVKFAANGNRIWASYVGGSNYDWEGRIACDISGNIYLTGCTWSTNFPTFAGHQMALAGGGQDAFLFKFNPAGARLWATYYGGSGTNDNYAGSTSYRTNGAGGAVACDKSGNVYISGCTSSPNNIATGGAYQTALAGSSTNAFLVKFNSTGTRQWGTYFGSGGEWISDISTDSNSNIYIFGEMEDNCVARSSCAYQPNCGNAAGGEDEFIAKFSTTGSYLCTTNLGGDGEEDLEEGGVGISIFGNYLYVAGSTAGPAWPAMLGFPVTSGAFQTDFGGGGGASYGGGDAYIAQLCINICEAKVLGLNFTPSPSKVCAGVPITFTPVVNNSCDTTGYKFQWTFPGGNPSSSTAVKPVVTYSASGNYTAKLVLTTICKKDSITKVLSSCVCTVMANAGVTAHVTCNGNKLGSATATVSSGSGGPYIYNWSNGQTSSVATGLTVGNYTVTVIDGACSASSMVTIVDQSTLKIAKTSTNISCPSSSGAVATVTPSGGVSPYSYSWSNGWGGTNSIGGLAAGGYTVTITESNGCTATSTFNITGSTPFVSAAFTISPSGTVCVGTAVNFINTGNVTGSKWGASYTTWLISPITPANVSGSTVDFSYTFLTAGTYNITHDIDTMVGNGVCYSRITQVVKVVNCNGPIITTTGSSVCPGSCATVTSSGSGGTAPYTYSWSTGATTQNIAPCPVSTTTYTVTVRDAGGNTSTSTAVVTVNPAVTVTTTATNISCNGGTNGSAAAAVGGGSFPYVYTWSTGATTSQISNLTSQIYTVTVTDSKGCVATSTASIISPLALTGQFTKGTANCINCGCKEWILVNATGGTSPYSYTWPDGYTNRYKNRLCPNSYFVNIKDKNGCSVNVSLTAP
ncbi:MAG: SBBP repeat-containing protein [Bacteroidetes bacterium]|nr:SBBP repeat-containing protein [Bacteroidota bacterium]